MREYARRAEELPDYYGQDIGERRELRKELRDEYGLLEIESLNIINGYWIGLYVSKYDRIRQMIPTKDDLAEIYGDKELLEKCLSEVTFNDIAKYGASL